VETRTLIVGMRILARMTPAVEPDLLMFVAGEPDTGEMRPGSMALSLPARLVGAVVPYQVLLASRGGDRAPSANGGGPSPGASRPLRLPARQVHCVNWVLEAADLESRRVTLIDVNRVDAPQDLIHRWVGENDLFPILVRPDGARLEGEESFDVRKVRKFLRRG
jgi:hypothetical protein